jgi:acyl carrier protein
LAQALREAYETCRLDGEIETIHRAIDTKGNLRLPARDLGPQADLYAVGVTPLAAIDVMIEIEREFRIVFPDRMLSRQIMASIEKIASCLNEVLADTPDRGRKSVADCTIRSRPTRSERRTVPAPIYASA